jgi:flagellar biosynthesis protein FlhF
MNSPFARQLYRSEEPAAGPSALEALRAELKNDVRGLRVLLSEQARRQPSEDLGGELAAIREALAEVLAAAGPRDAVSGWLRARGIEGAAAAHVGAIARQVEGDLATKLRAAVLEAVPLEPTAETSGVPKVIALVGPSGVGKTTTAAKLAARARIAGKSVAFISCDGFRVGAVDQLERYADLLGASAHLARTGAELYAALDGVRADVVFVDTSGRPPTSSSPETLLRKRAPRAEVLLCMAASTRAVDAARIASTFAPAKATAVAVTKIDETDARSGLIHASFAAKRPLALLCFGPRVPEDVEPATPEALLRHLGGLT